MNHTDRLTTAREYYALCREADALGIDVSLETNPALATTAQLKAAIEIARATRDACE